ncbi:hypothetical protein [Streptomyces sp. CT34]|uniref:hypothetical protein n=1 Tax=Streptomyces sp. CT34 TaxID=1553907 RepID=UPI00099BFC84|nr:hypothetical protein [Streptomyces sp. CT34]
MKKAKRAAMTLALAGMVLGGVVTVAGPAQASGRSGPCHTWHDGHTAGGWCDGRGPDYAYQTQAECLSNGSPGQLYMEFGPTRWFGDRRQSYAYCAPGRLYAAWLYEYYKGKLFHYVRID